MPLLDFTRAVILNRCLREGGFAGPRRAGTDTALWQSLSMLHPEQNAEGIWRGDSLYFFATPVHNPLRMLQSTLRDLSREYDIVPAAGEHFIESFIPRIIAAVADKKRSSMGDDIEMDAKHTAMITPLDALGLRSLMLSVFDLGDDSPDHQDEVLAHTGQMVFERFISESYDRLHSDDQAELEKLIESSEDPSDVLDFLESRLADFDSLLAGQVLSIKSEYDEIAQKVADTPVSSAESE
jgi:hypothetical protein